MKKVVFCFIFLALIQPAFAQKIPIRITPAQIISTHHDEVEIDDWIKFKVVQDVYCDGKLLFKKGAPVVGVVDYVLENGFSRDHAEIHFKKFIAVNTAGAKTEIAYDFMLGRNDYLTPEFGDKVVKYVGGRLFRGNEILIQPNSIEHNIIYEK